MMNTNEFPSLDPHDFITDTSEREKESERKDVGGRKMFSLEREKVILFEQTLAMHCSELNIARKAINQESSRSFDGSLLF